MPYYNRFGEDLTEESETMIMSYEAWMHRESGKGNTYHSVQHAKAQYQLYVDVQREKQDLYSQQYGKVPTQVQQGEMTEFERENLVVQQGGAVSPNAWNDLPLGWPPGEPTTAQAAEKDNICSDCGSDLALRDPADKYSELVCIRCEYKKRMTPAQTAEIDLSAATVDTEVPVLKGSVQRIYNSVWRLRELFPVFPTDPTNQLILRLRLLSAERDLNAAVKLCQETEQELRAADEATKKQ